MPLIYIFLVSLLVSWPPLALAQGQPALPSPALPAAPQQFLQETEAHRQRLEDAQRQRQLHREPSPIPAPVQEPPPSPDTPCWAVSGISLTGNQMIPSAALREAVQPHVSPCLSPGQINRLLAAITQVYAAAGYIASRPLLLAPPQDGQPLQLAVEEGFVEAIELAEEDLPVRLSAAFPHMLGQPLQLRKLEQGLDQLNRLRSVDLVADILPGALPGGSRIVLSALSRPNRWYSSIGWDNNGSLSTGRDRVNASLSLDNPFQHNDVLSLYANASQANAGAGSEALGLYYSMPYGPWSGSVSANHFRYHIRPQGQAAPLAFSGSSSVLSYSLERALWRDQHRLLSATWRLDDKRAEGRLQGRRLGVQSPRYRSLEVGLNGLWLGDSTWAGYLGYARGLGGWSGNDGRPVKQPGAQTARYGKWRASLSRTATYQWAGLQWTLVNAIQGQYSAQPLPSIEALALASGTPVRGFRSGGVDSASGAAWQNTLYLPWAPTPALQLTPSLGLDVGWADGHGRTPGARLLGASLGAGLSHAHGGVSLHYQRSLYRRGLATEPGYWRLAVQLQF